VPNTQWIKISSTGELPRGGLELLGASTKGADDIGQFGSGIKYAVVQALREKITIEVRTGTWICRFRTVPSQVGPKQFQQVVYEYEEAGAFTERSTSYTTDAACAWDQAWFILREFWANALDAGTASMRLVEDLEPPRRGWSDVYIEATSDILEAYDCQEHWMAEDRTVLYTTKAGRLLEAGCCEGLHIYLKGILILHKPGLGREWDYDFNFTRELNEVRLLDNDWSLRSSARTLLETGPLEIRKRTIELAGKGLSRTSAGTGRLFESDLSWLSANPRPWVEALCRLHKKPVLDDECTPEGALALVKQKGFEVVQLPPDLSKLLETGGVFRPIDVLSADRLQSVVLTSIEKARLGQVERALQAYPYHNLPIVVQGMEKGPLASVLSNRKDEPQCVILARRALADGTIAALRAVLKVRVLLGLARHEEEAKVDRMLDVATSAAIEAHFLREGEVIG
jgi:hypothetical protein